MSPLPSELRRALGMYLSLLLVLAAGLALAVALFLGPFSPVRRAQRELVRRLGPLEVSALVVTLPPPSENAALAFGAAADQIHLSGAERSSLETVFAEPPDAEPPRSGALAALADRNRPALEGAAAAQERAACSLGLDYTADPIAPDRSGEPADRLREEILAALIFVDGNWALDDHDTARLLRSFQLLGQLAGCVERETALSFQIRGAAVETLQHRLLARMLRDRAVSAAFVRQLPASLPRLDSREQLRRALRYEAAYYEKRLSGDGERHGLSDIFYSLRLADLLHEVLARLDAYDWPYDHVLTRRYRTRSGFVRRPDPDPATLKVTAQSRMVAQLAIAWRLHQRAPGDCAAPLPAPPSSADGLPPHPGDLQVRAAPGACVLHHAPAQAYTASYSAVSHLFPVVDWQITAP